MKKTGKSLWAHMIAVLAVVAMVMGSAPSVSAREVTEFDLQNKMGVAITELYIAPAIEGVPWSTNMLGEEGIGDGETVKVGFAPNAKTHKWDVKMVDHKGKVHLWGGLDLICATEVTIYRKDGQDRAAVKIPIEE